MDNFWEDILSKIDFSVHNLPFGIFSSEGKSPRVGVAIGDQVIDMVVFSLFGYFDDLEIDENVFNRKSLNSFIELGKTKTEKVRLRIQEMFLDPTDDFKEKSSNFLTNQSDVDMHLPVEIGDYTDFYSSEEHASNVGKLFRDAENPLLPNWKHMPIAYHGRASSIVVSGIDIIRPSGQIMTSGSDVPSFSPTKSLDFELELGYIIGKPSEQGEPVKIEDSEDYVFGVVLFNDWSARDIQRWEYQPLGPFLGKNFASSISPWVIPIEALESFSVAPPKQLPEVLSYLQGDHNNFDLTLEVFLKPENGEEQLVTNTNSKQLYWSIQQQLTHHTVNGCNLNVGDLLATGTISGTEDGTYGCLLEATKGGKKSIPLNKGERIFLEDGDTVIMRGYAQSKEIRIGLGEVTGKVLPAKK